MTTKTTATDPDRTVAPCATGQFTGADLAPTAWTLALTPRGLTVLLRETMSAWLDDHAPSMGAALAYYTLFSLAPLLLIAISVAGAVFGLDAARLEILSQMTTLVGTQGAHAVADLLDSVHRNNQTVIGTVVGFALLLVGATSVFVELQDALDRIWKVNVGHSASGWWHLLRTRLVSFGMILGIGFLLLVSLIVSAGLAAWGRWWAPAFGTWETLLVVVNNTFSFVLTGALIAMIYKYMPRHRVGWPDVWLGSAVTSLLFTLGKAAIGWYIGGSGVATAFGAASSVVVILVWVYWSAQVFLFGAEFTWVFAHHFGSRRHLRMHRVHSVASAPDKLT